MHILYCSMSVLPPGLMRSDSVIPSREQDDLGQKGGVKRSMFLFYA